MAKRDIVKAFLDVENQYFDMVNEIADYEKEFKDNFITQEQFENAQERLNLCKMNYDRWAYMIYLLNKPNRKEKQIKHASRQDNKKLGKYFDKVHATVEDTLDEGSDCLKKFKEYIESELKEDK